MKLKEFIKSTWQLPQNIIGSIVLKVSKAQWYCTYMGVDVYTWKNKNGGVSLGNYIFIPFKNTHKLDDTVLQYIKHEYGHTIQSRYLGWFYLLVIGLPSVIWSRCFQDYRKRTGKSYYSFYTEKSADKLGGVKR